MSQLHLITYDLNRPGQNYSSLFEAIRSIGANWHPMDSVWFVRTTWTAANVRDHLLPHIDQNDTLFVSRVTEAAWHGLRTDGATWIQQSVAA